ncbi:transporter substrate-binding domain-containing protein [Thermodesulfobacteriota bacterium]
MTIRRYFFIPLATVMAVMATMLVSVSASANISPERISIAYCKDSVPFHFTDESGQPAGIMIDLWRLWSKKTGIAVNFVEADWDETLSMVGSGAADAHAGLFFTEERDKFLDYGAKLTKTDTHYFYHVALPQIKKVKSLAAYRVGVIDGDYVEKYLKEKLPEGNVIPFADYGDIMNELREGNLRVFAADTPTGLFHLQKNGLLSEYTYVSETPLYQNDFFFAVREGNRELIEIINRGVALISDDEKREINRRWFVSGEKEENALIISIDRDYRPFTFVNTLGRPSGLFIDMWRQWARKSGKKIQFRPSGWTETVESLRTGDADIHSGLSFSEERAEWIGFSDLIYETYTRVYHKIGDKQPSAIEDYGTDKIGTMSGTYQEAEFRKTFPNLSLKSFATNQELVDALLKDEIIAIVQEDQFMEAALDRLGLRGTIISRPEKLFPSTIHAGVRKGNTELLQQINRGFAGISKDKLAGIEKRWVINPESHYYQTDEKIALNAEEEAWIKENPVIRVHNEKDWAPYNFSENGKPSGYSIDYMNLLASKIGIEVEYITGPSWDEFMQMIRNNELDVMLNIAVSPEREKFLAFTDPYLKLIQALFTRTDYPLVTSIQDLYGKTFAIPKGFYLQEILKTYPEIKILEVENSTEAIKAVSFGKADAIYDIMPVVGHISNQLQINNLKVGGEIRKVATKPIPLHIGMRKEDQVLAGIFNKAMNTITSEELEVLNQRWLKATGVSQQYDLSKILSSREMKWLLKHNAFELGIDPAWKPFEFIDKDGKYSGISSGYVEAVENRLQVEMKPVLGLSRAEVVEKAKNREIDIIPATTTSSEHEKYLHLSKPYISYPIIIAAHKNMPYFNHLNDLKGYRVGVIKKSFTDEMLSKDYPDLPLNRYPALAAGLKELNAGELDAFVDNLSAITYEITKSNLGEIKISAPTEYKFELAFGVRKDWPELAGILNKVIDNISEKEKLSIKNNWLAPVEIQYGIDIKRILMWIVPIVLSVLSVMVFVFVWNRRLSNEITERKNKEKLIVLSGKITQLLTLGYTLQETLQSITDIIVKELDVVFSRIWIVDETENVLKLQASSGLYTHIKGAHEYLPIGGDTKIGRVVDEKRPQVSNSIQDSPYVKDKDWAREQKLKSVAGIPMIVEGRAVGALVVFSRETIQKDTINTILSVGDSIAVAIDRTRAEETVRESEERNRLLLESAGEGIFGVDSTGKAVFVNPAAVRMLGYSERELIDQLVHPLIHHSYPDGSPYPIEKCPMQLACEQGIASHERIEVLWRKDGTSFYAAYMSTPMIKKDALVGAMVTFMDISEQKKAEDTLQKRLEDLTTARLSMLNMMEDLEDTRKESEKRNIELQSENIERKKIEEELRLNMEDLERFTEMAVGREEKMIQLKEEINELMNQLGRDNKYKIV